MSESLRNIPVDLIQRGQYQPRRKFPEGALNELAESIEASGVIQPVVVRAIDPPGRFELLAGERRWRAAQLAGLHEIPAVVREDVSDQEALEVAITENLQREDVNAIEEAEAFGRLSQEFELRHEDIAARVGKSRAYVTNAMRLLRLPEAVRVYIEEGMLDAGHGKALGALDGRPQVQTMLAREATKRKLSVRQLETRIASWSVDKPRTGAPKLDLDVRALCQELTETTGMPASIRGSGKEGGGVLSFRFSNPEELEGLLRHLPRQ